MGDKAKMPLYYILYKSPNNDMYEYICAVALSELTGLDFMKESGDYYDWTSGKEYLELFNKYIVDAADSCIWKKKMYLLMEKFVMLLQCLL